jgi:glycosyltransferase involved in cell wall biosynthesis
VADDLSKHGIPSSKIRIVPNGVDTALFRVRSKEAIMDLSPQAIAPSLKTEDGERKLPDSGIRPPGFGSPSEVRGLKSVVLYVGNLVPVKGPDIMLRAFAALQERRRDAGSETWNAKGERPVGAEALPPPASGPQSDVSLLIIGTGPMRAKLERMARDLGVADKVRFLGSRPHAEVARWMNRADVLCLTSRSEGMPNVVVEALASGLPVVATDVGACPELLADEPEARVCRREDVGGIAVALADCLGRDIDREAVADRCSSRYSWRKAAERLLDVLQVGEPAGDGRPS